jgi:hypothetical protein
VSNYENTNLKREEVINKTLVVELYIKYMELSVKLQVSCFLITFEKTQITPYTLYPLYFII